MKTKNLKIIIDELNKLPKTIINMHSLKKPTCETPGCFAGLISLIINKIPELNKIYSKHRIFSDYDYVDFGYALSKYLGLKNINNFDKWMHNNAKIWGNGYEYCLFLDPETWEQKEICFSHNIIIKKLESVYNNLIKKENEQ